MDPMTDSVATPEQGITRFYDDLAGEYDLMTGFDSRFVREKPFFRLLVERYRIHTAVDAGSGTGFHSLLLAQLGVRVTAVDASGVMLQKLRDHAAELRLDVVTEESFLQEIDVHRLGPVDAVFCMGNTLSHCRSAADLTVVLRRCYSLLRPGGVLFLQVLNYERILRSRERIQSVRESDGVIFIRFFDFLQRETVFNILRLNRANGGIRHALQSIVLRPLLREELLSILAGIGFTREQTFGGISMSAFSEESGDLVILAAKGEEKE